MPINIFSIKNYKQKSFKKYFTMSKKGGAKGKQVQSNVFDAKKYERPGLSSDEVEEIKEAFDLFDTDQSGSISVSELTSAMKSLGFDVKHAVVFQMIAELDADGKPPLVPSSKPNLRFR